MYHDSRALKIRSPQWLTSNKSHADRKKLFDIASMRFSVTTIIVNDSPCTRLCVHRQWAEIFVTSIWTRKPSWRKGFARQQCVYEGPYGRNPSSATNSALEPKSRRSANRLRSCGHFCISKMAVSRHLGFYQIANSGIRSADPENSWARTKHGVDRMHRLRDVRL